MVPDPHLLCDRDLIDYHRGRGLVYATLAELIAGHVTAEAQRRWMEQLSTAERLLMIRGAVTQRLRQLIEGSTAAELALSYRTHIEPLPQDCGSPACNSRCRALRAAGVEALDGICADLMAMARLALRTEELLGTGDLTGASITSYEQARFLREHAQACLGSAADRLMAAPGDLAKAVGQTLRAVVENDRWLLGDAPVTAA